MAKNKIFQNPRGEYAYYVVDLADNTYIPFRTKDKLLEWWAVNGGEQNLTGKDTIAYPDLHDSNAPPKIYLRRWQVYDENWRVVDIRDIAAGIVDTKVQNTSPQGIRAGQVGSIGSGRRQHRHRASGPSMYRRDLRNNDIAHSQDTDAPYTAQKPQHMSVGENWDYYEKSFFSSPSRNWKDQSKAKRQYRKH